MNPCGKRNSRKEKQGIDSMAKVKGKVRILLEIDRVLTSQELHGLNGPMQEIKS